MTTTVIHYPYISTRNAVVEFDCDAIPKKCPLRGTGGIDEDDECSSCSVPF